MLVSPSMRHCSHLALVTSFDARVCTLVIVEWLRGMEVPLRHTLILKMTETTFGKVSFDVRGFRFMTYTAGVRY